MEDELHHIAGEYVIGTLSAEERAKAEALIGTDARFAALVEAWERHLAPLDEDQQLTPNEVQPPEHLWQKIHARLDQLTSHQPTAAAPKLLTEANDNLDQRQSSISTDSLRRSRNRWRAAAIGAAALAAAFIGLQAGGIMLPFAPKPEPAGRFVAVLNPQGSSPGFLIRVDIGARRLAVERLANQAPDGKDYELWLIEPDAKPKSLNVVGRDKVQQVSFRSEHEGQALQFAVTLEPEGGSPSGVATGPIVFSGQLLPAE